MEKTKPSISRWSFSAVKQFEQCPYNIYQARILRLPRPELPPDNPLNRGSRIHKEAELFVKGEGPYTASLSKHKERLLELQAAFSEGRLEVEDAWCFDQDWHPVNKEDPAAWLMFIPDAVEHLSDTTARLTDYKTGKSFGKELRHGEQMQLGAICALMRYPNLITVEIELLYLDEKKNARRTFDRTRVPPLLKRWTERGNKLLECSQWVPKANKSNCRYCDFGPNVGTGACPYGVEQ